LAYSAQQLAYIVTSMEQAVTGKPLAGMSQPVDTELLLLLSHDTNILYLRELLDINWTPYGYTSGVASTAGSLQFELWKKSDTGDYYVKVRSPLFQRSYTIAPSCTAI